MGLGGRSKQTSYIVTNNSSNISNTVCERLVRLPTTIILALTASQAQYYVTYKKNN